MHNVLPCFEDGGLTNLNLLDKRLRLEKLENISRVKAPCRLQQWQCVLQYNYVVLNASQGSMAHIPALTWLCALPLDEEQRSSTPGGRVT